VALGENRLEAGVYAAHLAVDQLLHQAPLALELDQIRRPAPGRRILWG
jgi:hypothetical protein